jgi:NAD(P)-dependent dehydrogenase (short-subunit alcohol dehydrogenase family)
VNKPFNEKVGIITGGSSGIGRSTGVALARQGASVVVVGKNPLHVTETIAEIKSEVKIGMPEPVGLVFDVRQERDMQEMARQTLARFGRIDILVNCAGVGAGPKPLGGTPRSRARLSVQEWDTVLETNLKGTFLSSRAVLRTMIARRTGDIINVSSARGGVRGIAYGAAYSASKFGIIGLSQSTAEEVRQYGVRIQVLLPDVTDTPLLHRTTLASGLGSLLSPARVADLIVTMLKLPADSALLCPVILPIADRKAEDCED